ncbi:hypothetical protein FJ958_27310, partial [Mesorhizobium sp. B2-3-5]
ARRRAWFKAQPDLDPERLVFIDETGAAFRSRAPHKIHVTTPFLRFTSQNLEPEASRLHRPSHGAEQTPSRGSR